MPIGSQTSAVYMVSKRRKPQACLTLSLGTDYHNRWHGLDFHLL